MISFLYALFSVPISSASSKEGQVSTPVGRANASFPESQQSCLDVAIDLNQLFLQAWQHRERPPEDRLFSQPVLLAA